jgi:hypothetical protein
MIIGRSCGFGDFADLGIGGGRIHHKKYCLAVHRILHSEDAPARYAGAAFGNVTRNCGCSNDKDQKLHR